jgi:ABC-2 type transport system ATP-binding protein
VVADVPVQVPVDAARDPVIVVDRLGIQFYRGRRRNISLREIVFRGGAMHDKQTFWGLRDISFSVGPGEAVGLVGGNGSGKSTLLKMIAGTLVPAEGYAEVQGGVAPLIELTGGFVGELSGRENVSLIAGLHRLTRAQIDERFDDIVEFAGPEVRSALEMPFRHYSSGMKVRLGFAVVTSLNEPVVLVDEVLAVGDAAFRDKCYQRMETLLGEGRTLFLVSHSEADLRRFCTRGIYLRHGALVEDGPLEPVLQRYVADIRDGG